MKTVTHIILLSLVLTGLVIPFPTALAKGGGEDLAFSEVEASPRTYWLDASMSPQLEGCEEGSLAHSFPALYDPDPVYFDGDSTYYFRPFQCGDQVPPQALMALASFRPDLDTLIFIQKDPLTGEVFDEEVDSAWYQDMAEGFLSQMKAAVGEKRTRAILTTLGAVGAGVGLTLLAGKFALVGGVLLPVMISLGGLYLIHFYQDLLYRGDFRQMGEHLFWDVLVGGVAYGSSRAVRWVRTSPVIEQLKSTVSRVGGWISRLRTQVRYHLDKPKIDRALDEIWAQAHRPGGGDLGPASPARPSSGGGVATLTRPRVLPKTELIRKPQTKPWTLNPAELSGTRPLHTPQTSSIPSPQAAAQNLTIGDQVQRSSPLQTGYAEGIGQHDLKRFAEHNLDQQGLLPSQQTRSPIVTRNASDSDQGGPPDLPSHSGWQYSQPDDDEFRLSHGRYVVNFQGGHMNITMGFNRALKSVGKGAIPMILPHPITAENTNVYILNITTSAIVTTDQAGNFQDLLLILENGIRFSIPQETWPILHHIISYNGDVILWPSVPDGRIIEPAPLIRVRGQNAQDLLERIEGLLEGAKEAQVTEVESETLAFMEMFLTRTANILQEIDIPFQRLPQEARNLIRFQGLKEPSDLYRRFQDILLLQPDRDPAEKLNEFIDVLAQEQERFELILQAIKDDFPHYSREFSEMRGAYNALFRHVDTLSPESLGRMLNHEPLLQEREISEFTVDQIIAQVESGDQSPYSLSTSPLDRAEYSLDEILDSFRANPEVGELDYYVPKSHDQLLSLGPKIGRRLYDLIVLYEDKLLSGTQQRLSPIFFGEVQRLKPLAETLSNNTEPGKLNQARREAQESLPKMLRFMDELQGEAFHQTLPQDPLLSEAISKDRDLLVDAIDEVINVLSQKVRPYAPPVPEHLVPTAIEKSLGHLRSIVSDSGKTLGPSVRHLRLRLDHHVQLLLTKMAQEKRPAEHEKVRMQLAKEIPYLDRVDDQLETWLENTEGTEERNNIESLRMDLRLLTNNIRGLVQTRLKPSSGMDD